MRNHTDCFGRSGQYLIVLAEAAGMIEPGKRTFHDPAPGKLLPFVRLDFLRNINTTPQPLYRGYLRHAPPPPADFPMYLRRCAASCLSFFSTVYPAFLCRAGRFDALGINDRIAWHRFAPGSLPGYFDQVPQYLLPQPTQTGTPVETVHSRIGWKIVRQVPPLTPCFHKIQHCVC